MTTSIYFTVITILFLVMFLTQQWKYRLLKRLPFINNPYDFHDLETFIWTLEYLITRVIPTIGVLVTLYYLYSSRWS